MKNVLKAIGAGLAMGVALFLVPFLGRLLLFGLLLRVAFRLLGGRRRRRWAAWAGQGYGPLGFGGPVPIDGQWPRPAAPAAGPASEVLVG